VITKKLLSGLALAVACGGGAVNNVVCVRSIADIERGNSNDVFFGRPS